MPSLCNSPSMQNVRKTGTSLQVWNDYGMASKLPSLGIYRWQWLHHFPALSLKFKIFLLIVVLFFFFNMNVI